MNINAIKSNNSFGKYPVMSCTIKERNSDENIKATVYQLDINNRKDLDEVKQSKNTDAIKSDFIVANIEGRSPYSFYFIKNDKTGEVISCAESSRRYSPEIDNGSYYTCVEELSQNNKYANSSSLPLLLYIAKTSAFDSYLKIAAVPRDKEILEDIGFKETSYGELCLSKKDYNNLISKATSDNNIEFLV